jgi:hypothetical protein
MLMDNFHMRKTPHRITSWKGFLRMGEGQNILYSFQVHRIINNDSLFCIKFHYLGKEDNTVAIYSQYVV